MKVLQLVNDCDDCPRRSYYSGGRYEYGAANTVLPPASARNFRPPEWCPLTDYPSAAMERLRQETAEGSPPP